MIKYDLKKNKLNSPPPPPPACWLQDPICLYTLFLLTPRVFLASDPLCLPLLQVIQSSDLLEWSAHSILKVAGGSCQTSMPRFCCRGDLVDLVWNSQGCCFLSLCVWCGCLCWGMHRHSQHVEVSRRLWILVLAFHSVWDTVPLLLHSSGYLACLPSPYKPWDTNMCYHTYFYINSGDSNSYLYAKHLSSFKAGFLRNS